LLPPSVSLEKGLCEAMNEEQIARKKQYAGEKHASMKRRDDHHDYTERRMYMITLEVEGRRPLFGRLVGSPFAERGSNDEPRIELTELGKAVQSEWMGIHGYYPQIEVKAVQMMPDHMHGILFVTAPLPVHLGQVISGFKAGCRKAQKALEAAAAEPQPTEKEIPPSPQASASPSPQTSASSSPQASASSSPQASASPSPQASVSPSQKTYRPLFAKGYNDLILRSYDELPIWQNYLRDNPRRLMMKRANPEWLRPFFGLKVGTTTYSSLGNQALLRSPRRIAVRVSRRLDSQQIEMEKARYLDMARQGTVLVSPAISPGEKLVMRAAFDAGLPTIVLMENGFTPLTKPKGEQFDACAEGRLLLLAPWEHHNEKRTITAYQCQQLNLMAIEICDNKVK
jgi:hypothetical protein